jgi:phage-related protein
LRSGFQIHSEGGELRFARATQVAIDEADANGWPGVQEIRVHAGNEYRVMYVAKFEEAVYVLHAFEKKTQRTPKQDLDLAGDRFRDLVEPRVIRVEFPDAL